MPSPEPAKFIYDCPRCGEEGTLRHVTGAEVQRTIELVDGPNGTYVQGVDDEDMRTVEITDDTRLWCASCAEVIDPKDVGAHEVR